VEHRGCFGTCGPGAWSGQPHTHPDGGARQLAPRKPSAAQQTSGPEPATVRRDQIAQGARGPGTKLPHKWLFPSQKSSCGVSPTGHARSMTSTQRGPRHDRRARRIVCTLVSGTRLSPLLVGLGPPPARPRPGPGGSALAASIPHGPRAGQ
jgi:hypothetical protein